jgi:hypothetical protein
LVYTDAEEGSSYDYGLGVVIVSPLGNFTASYRFSQSDLLEMKISIKTKNIFGLEMLEALLGRYLSNSIHESVDCRNEIAFVDNEGVRLSLINGTSKRLDIQPLIDLFWLSSSSTTVWVDRVKSECNPADAPSRSKSYTAQDLLALNEAYWLLLTVSSNHAPLIQREGFAKHFRRFPFF